MLEVLQRCYKNQVENNHIFFTWNNAITPSDRIIDLCRRRMIGSVVLRYEYLEHPIIRHYVTQKGVDYLKSKNLI